MTESAALVLSGALSGRLDGALHVFPLRVYYEDTDAGGIVYHANYLRYAERARTEMLRLLGVPHARQVATTGVAFAVRRCGADFLAPARLEDALEVRTRITGLTGATVLAEQMIYRPCGEGPQGRGDDLLVRLTLKLACINAHGRPVRVPAPVVAAFRRLGVGMETSGDGAPEGRPLVE